MALNVMCYFFETRCTRIYTNKHKTRYNAILRLRLVCNDILASCVHPSLVFSLSSLLPAPRPLYSRSRWNVLGVYCPALDADDASGDVAGGKDRAVWWRVMTGEIIIGFRIRLERHNCALQSVFPLSDRATHLGSSNPFIFSAPLHSTQTRIRCRSNSLKSWELIQAALIVDSLFVIDVGYSSHQLSRGHQPYNAFNPPNAFWLLTLWRPLLPYGHSYKVSCARPGQAVICNFWHPGTLTLSPGVKNYKWLFKPV